ncbi:hypothetical protein HMPREF2141_03860 [Bacteroides uniformis]|nr:hypothetical protein HMPREF2141_03860 [Bacteroides uniformis]
MVVCFILAAKIKLLSEICLSLHVENVLMCQYANVPMTCGMGK